MSILDKYIDCSNYKNYDNLNESERAEVQRIVNAYKGVDMNVFINRIGGLSKIEEMKRINDAADGLYIVGGQVVHRSKHTKDKREDLEEWKQGFMEGFEEAYKRLQNVR